MQTANTRPVLKSIFENPVVKKYMQIPSFVGLNGKRVVGNTIILAFPLWIFEYNLQMLDELVCGNASTLDLPPKWSIPKALLLCACKFARAMERRMQSQSSLSKRTSVALGTLCIM